MYDSAKNNKYHNKEHRNINLHIFKYSEVYAKNNEIMAQIIPSSESKVIVPLLKLESNPMMLHGAGITTIQFYKGLIDEAAVALKVRLREVATRLTTRASW